MEGDDISTNTTKTTAACLDLCEKHALCKFGVFNPRSRICTLKSNASFLTKEFDSFLVARSYKDFRRIADQVIEGNDVDNGHQHGNLDGKFHPVPAEDVCLNLCKVHPLCNVASYGTGGDAYMPFRNACLLRRVISTINSRPSEGHVSYVA